MMLGGVAAPMPDYLPHDSIRIWLILALTAVLLLIFARPTSAWPGLA